MYCQNGVRHFYHEENQLNGFGIDDDEYVDEDDDDR